MKLTKGLLRKLVREAVEDEMGLSGSEDSQSATGSSTPKKQLSRAAIRHLENSNFDVEHDPYDNGPSIGHVAEEIGQEGNDGEPMKLPESFIATEEAPNKDKMDDDQRWRHADLGNYEYWVGTYRNWQAPESEKVYKKTGESLDGYFVIEHTGTSWNYIAGPFDSAEQAKSEGVKLAKEKGMIPYDELEGHTGTRSYGSGLDEPEEETDERLAEMRKIRQGFRKLLK